MSPAAGIGRLCHTMRKVNNRRRRRRRKRKKIAKPSTIFCHRQKPSAHNFITTRTEIHIFLDAAAVAYRCRLFSLVFLVCSLAITSIYVAWKMSWFSFNERCERCVRRHACLMVDRQKCNRRIRDVYRNSLVFFLAGRIKFTARSILPRLYITMSLTLTQPAPSAIPQLEKHNKFERTYAGQWWCAAAGGGATRCHTKEHHRKKRHDGVGNGMNCSHETR